ncbi:MAG: DUF58 domain-containing protein [Spirochaetaceae bacterium]|jgi:uncharacterized protein (DUF58 family)|nr:DUF58 domain-containing protein [Spirochaetaceae bacterium]
MKPGAALFIAALLWLLLGTAGFFFSALSLVWFLAGISLLPLIIADGLVTRLLYGSLEVSREIPATLALGEPCRVILRFRAVPDGILPFGFLLFDLYPDSLECTVFPAPLQRKSLRNSGVLIFEYTLIPLDRGAWEFSGLELLYRSPCRFWSRKVFQPCISRGRTYPDFKKLTQAAGKDLRGIRELSGRIPRKRGQGMEFLDLREYQPGDSVRAIDWRATGRRGKVIIREYQEEQDQQVLFILDSGYRLHRREGDYLQFDSALNAALLLSYAALKHGDSVAALSFGAEERWLPPGKGPGALTGLLNKLYDLKSAPVPSSPFSALENALGRIHRRTFIILISNFREEDGESLSWILPRIRERHLLLLVNLREKEAEELAFRRPEGAQGFAERAAALSYLRSRQRLYKTWEHLGLLTLETSSIDISADLINRYLLVKRSGRL